ncbi:Leucine--tRNA ligase [Chlamydiales bacterium STE3]|nr:Leucine--tRNA ligase [Chlamydiales bacterium STE3]
MRVLFIIPYYYGSSKLFSGKIMKYDHKTIESKWQKFWEDNKIFKSVIDTSKPKYYVLDMFPYPSGSGLHVGHPEGYTATDILARYKRAKGFNVLHPMGWDSFGLPAEQYAIRTGTHPAITTKHNIENFKRQLKSLGFSYDWDRELATSDASYYKWTQWIFTKLYEKGLAYEAEQLVNYCPELGTVLANEEIENGRSKEGGYLVEKRPLRQWILKITDYAERLIDDLALLDWPESLKKLQTNWIGKSEGAHVQFKVKDATDEIKIFTTRPDTLFGSTFLVLAPEHPLVSKIASKKQQALIKEYNKNTAMETEAERTDISRKKTGVFTGAYAVNPLSGKEMPIWIADYVLMGYGTGAIMAVPAHDERDFDFAKAYGLDIIPVFDPDLDRFSDLIPKNTTKELFREEILGGRACWLGEGTYINSKIEDLDLSSLNFEKAKKAVIDWLEKRELGTSTITYKLRDWLFARQRYWGEPFPILHFEDGTRRALEEDELPLCPPDLSDFKPSGDGQSPLAKAKEWIEIFDSRTGKKALRESNTMPQWAGSCWYYLRFCDPENHDKAWSQEAENYWMPVDMYVGGVEHAVLHLLYARFWHKVLFDCGYVSTPEPFQTLRNQGIIVARSYQRSSGAYVPPEQVIEKNGKYIDRMTGEELRSQIEKMSKSKLNGVTPDDIIEEFGADALRLYEMFMGPLEKEKVWNTDAVNGCRRFLSRFFEMATSEKVADSEASLEALKYGNRLVYGVSKDIEAMQFNTAIAKMMEFINDFTRLPLYPKSVVKSAIQCLAPFAPHIAEELWEHLGFQESLSYANFPTYETKYLEDATITYVVQINGKVRGRFELPKDQNQEAILHSAKHHPIIEKYLDGKTIDKVIFVPNKLLNLVIQD